MIPLELKETVGTTVSSADLTKSIMSFAMGNAITLEDTNGNRKLLKALCRKDRSSLRINGCLGCVQTNKETFE